MWKTITCSIIFYSLWGALEITCRVEYTQELFHSLHLLPQERYINGARVTLRDACDRSSVAGALHVIDQVLTPVFATAVQVLQSDSRLSMFTSALSRAGLIRFLNISIPHTVFAPTNEAFNNSQYSSELLDCLLAQRGSPLRNLLFYHMSPAVEFSNSLTLQRNWIRTLFGHLRVQVNDNSTIVLGEDNVEIIEPDIPAQNGVVHIIDEVLAPPVLDFQGCFAFSTTPPPTTIAPPTSSGSGGMELPALRSVLYPQDGE